MRSGHRAITGAVSAFALAILAHSAGAADPPREMTPTGPWVADFADESCALRRTFGSGGSAVSFEMRQFAPGPTAEIAIASSLLEVRRNGPQFHFLPAGQAELLRGGPQGGGSFHFEFRAPDGRKGVMVPASLMRNDQAQAARDLSDSFIWAAPDRDAREREITGFHIEGAFDSDVVLLTGSLHEPMKIMRTCFADLMTRWGLDPGTQDSLTRNAALLKPETWIERMGSLRRRIMRNRTSAQLRVRALVDETGKTIGCKVLALTGDDELAADICEALLGHVDFRPALDSASQPAKSYYVWQLLAVSRYSPGPVSTRM